MSALEDTATLASLFLLPENRAVEAVSPTKSRLTLFRIYISGDTLVFRDLRKISQRFPEIDLALLNLGRNKDLRRYAHYGWAARSGND